MTTEETAPAARPPLSRNRVLRAAVALADREGLDALTMRRLAGELDVEAMSLYHHVANKEAVLDGVVDVVVGEAAAAAESTSATGPDDWQATLRARILAARRVLVRHPWAPTVIESRLDIGPATAVYMDGILATLRTGGFSWDLAHHAMHALGSRALGFTQELFQPDDAASGEQDDAAMLEQMASIAPNIIEMVSTVAHEADDDALGWCDDQSEFEFGLDIVLEGLESRRRAAAAA